MPGPHKITLARAKAQGGYMLMLYCVWPAICPHSGLTESMASLGQCNVSD